MADDPLNVAEDCAICLASKRQIILSYFKKRCEIPTSTSMNDMKNSGEIWGTIICWITTQILICKL